MSADGLAPRAVGAPAVLVCGSLNADLVVYQADGVTGAGYSHGRAFECGTGGKGLNVAVGLAACGARTHLVGRVGDDVLGDMLRATLNRTGVHAEHVRVDRSVGSGVGHVRVGPRGEYDTCVVAGANARVSPEDVDEALGGDVPFSHLVLQLEIPRDTVLHAAGRAQDLGVRVVLNASPVIPGAADLLALTDVLVVNEAEARELAREVGDGSPPSTDPWDLMESLRSVEGPRDVVVTRGGRGALALARDGARTDCPARSTQVVNTVGAGDAFLAALVAGLAVGVTLAEAVRRATAAGARACGHGESWLARDDVRHGAGS